MDISINEQIKAQNKSYGRQLYCLNKYLYLAKDSDGRVKIGHSCNPYNRVKSISNKINKKVELIFKKKGAAIYEKMLHNYFSEKNIEGEWFNLTNKDIDSIKEFDFLDYSLL